MGLENRITKKDLEDLILSKIKFKKENNVTASILNILKECI